MTSPRPAKTAWISPLAVALVLLALRPRKDLLPGEKSVYLLKEPPNQTPVPTTHGPHRRAGLARRGLSRTQIAE